MSRRKFFQIGGALGAGTVASYAIGGLSELSAKQQQSSNYGYVGNVLWVDLDSSTIRLDKPDKSIYRNFLGGYGLGARLIYDELKQRDKGFQFDALDPENVIGFEP